MDDLGEQYNIVTSNGWVIEVCKIKSHTLETGEYDPEYDSDVMPHEHRIGNSKADYWIDLAAKQASVVWALACITG